MAAVGIYVSGKIVHSLKQSGLGYRIDNETIIIVLDDIMHTMKMIVVVGDIQA